MTRIGDGGSGDSDPTKWFDVEWPNLPQDWIPESEEKAAEIKAAYYGKVMDHALDRFASQSETAGQRQQKINDTDQALQEHMYESLMDASIGSIDRSKSAAEFVQTAAGALAGLYTGIAALLIAKDTTLPSRALIPTLFFGIAVVLAAYYLAYLGPRKDIKFSPLTGTPANDATTRANNVAEWARSITLTRASALRAAVISLAFGLVFLPVGFVHPSTLPVLNGVLRAVSPDNVPASAQVKTAGASPTPQTSWPPPPSIEPVQLAQTLYEAQLRQYRADLTAKAAIAVPAEGGADDAVAWLLFLAGIATVYWRFRKAVSVEDLRSES